MPEILFIPFRPNSSRCGRGMAHISQHQHAAREYHRRRKAQRGKKSDLAPDDLQFYAQQAPSFGVSLSHSKEVILRPPSPYTLLGAGRYDPLDTFCETTPPLYAQEMLDHAIMQQWSIFRQSDNEMSMTEIKADIMQSVMSRPVAWHTVILAGAVHNAYRYGGQSPVRHNEILRLAYKTKAISCLLAELKEKELSETTLMCMMTLAAHGAEDDITRSTVRGRQPFLATGHDTFYYTTLETGAEHLLALRAVLEKRGGLGNIQMKTLRSEIQLYDILIAWTQLARPHFALLQPTALFLGRRRHQPDSTARILLLQLGSGFRAIPMKTDIYPLFAVVKSLNVITADLDQYLRTKSVRPISEQPDIILLKHTRLLVAHDLLSLQTDVADNHDSLTQCIHELCRIVTIAYSAVVIIPVHPKIGLAFRVASSLKSALNEAVSEGIYFMPRYYNLLLCATIWGGICAMKSGPRYDGSNLLTYFAEMLSTLTVKIEFQAWPLVHSIMKTFLWLDSQCEEDGLAFWEQACGNRYGVSYENGL